ncbi:hypothetical protein IAG44_20280 [Streptomyces roseirectus]|uniref:Uncharacterized protein n=1 Tax=Streptomyces roseirectus TaxID=2768066 RepID=A0A7H0IFG8_9ACTN|nr:hypothetical protein [Streptomyces roseirectus]QNP71534.1 hypothetical protein IAG44_20280 [Streptomyces roseirectus]
MHNELSQALHSLAPDAALIRVFPKRQGMIHFYGADFFMLLAPQDVEERAARLIRQHFGDAVDWRLPHDFHVPTGCLYVTPHPDRVGYVPEDDRSFGLLAERYVATAHGGDR